MGRRENEEGKVGKARSCLLANTRITVGYAKKIYYHRNTIFLASIEN